MPSQFVSTRTMPFSTSSPFLMGTAAKAPAPPYWSFLTNTRLQSTSDSAGVPPVVVVMVVPSGWVTTVLCMARTSARRLFSERRRGGCCRRGS